MKTLSILASLLISFSVNISAHAEQPNRSYFTNSDQIILAESTAKRHKFNSRHGYRNPAVHDKDRYKADDEWEGATYVEESEAKDKKASKRLNRQFRSRRPYIDYQFD